MSIETLLTLGVAAGILGLAVVLRFAVLTAARLVARLSGQEVRPVRKTPPEQRQPKGERISPRRQRQRSARERVWPRIGDAGRSVGAGAAFVARGFVEGLRVAATGLLTVTVVVLASAAQTTRRSAASLGPRIAAGGKASWRGAASAWRWLKPRVVLAVATVQHLGRASLQRVREWVSQRQEERSSRPGEPSSAGHGPQVIDLKEDWDPLTDEFPEDWLTPSR